jgi:threonine/homoserine/homoserine lactone efflux protein
VTLSTWWVFVCAVFLVSAIPGPNMLHVMTRSVHYGLKASIVAMLGLMTGLLLILAASVAGLSAVLLAAPMLFDVIRYAGVAYLIYIGIKSWRAPVTEMSVEAPVQRLAPSVAVLFRDGFFISISNPKALIFLAAFLPQFINPDMPRGPQFAILVPTMMVIEFLWNFAYALSGRQIAGYLTRASWQRAFNRLSGVLFVGFGLALLGFRR